MKRKKRKIEEVLEYFWMKNLFSRRREKRKVSILNKRQTSRFMWRRMLIQRRGIIWHFCEIYAWHSFTTLSVSFIDIFSGINHRNIVCVSCWKLNWSINLTLKFHSLECAAFQQLNCLLRVFTRLWFLWSYFQIEGNNKKRERKS